MNRPRVVVIGGGAIGCSVAFHLAKAGIATTLIERDSVGGHASGSNPGNLNPILGSPPGLLPFALECFRLHRSLAKELAAIGCPPYRIEPVKRVLVAFDENDLRELGAVERDVAPHEGFSATRLEARELRSIEPRLSEAIAGGLLIEGNESLDSRSFVRSLAEAARKAGAVLMRAEAVGVERDGDRVVRGVHVANGTHACDALVVATGPWTSATTDWLGFELPVEPVKGEMLRMRLPGANVTHDLTHGLISLYRRGDDEVWVGVTRERRGFDEVPTAEARRALIEGAARIMPAIREATLLEPLAALRPATPTGLPIVGKVPGWDNVFAANGGGIKGMLLCTGMGAAIADLVITGRASLPVGGFFPRGAH